MTSPTPTTRPAKNPNRVAASKRVAERTRAARKVQKSAAVIIENSKMKARKAKAAAETPAPAAENSTSSLSTTQWLAVGGIVVSFVGIYYKREEIKALYNKKVAPQHVPQQPVPAEPEPATIALQQACENGHLKHCHCRHLV